MINSLSELQGKLGYTLTQIKVILSNKEEYYYHFSKLKQTIAGEKKYRHFNPSKSELKDLHNRIHTRIFGNITLPKHVQGCVRGRGNITNAKLHKGKLFKFHTDLRSYFDYVTNAQVYQALSDLGYSQKVSHYLTKITTHKGHLTQGPPTSPFLANIAALRMDKQILQLCKENGITYSRFVDDLCFSSQMDFKHLVPDIIRIINEAGYLIGYRKTKYKKGSLEITGCDIRNNILRPTVRQMEKYVDPDTPDFTRKGLANYFKGLKKK